MKYPHLLSFALSIFFVMMISSCEESKQQEKADEASGTITISKLQNSPEFPTASLSLTSATPGEAGSYAFQFAVAGEGYKLGDQTEPKPSTFLSNSGHGQHIHLIVDNGPYEAHYTSTITKDDLGGPGRHVVLAFLSRSYHESIKNMNDPQSYVLAQYHVGEGSSEEVDFSTPHLFYSRPKGEYVGADAEHLLLDFFLVNADLSADGYKVRATIQGEEFMLDEWAPYVIDGLAMGEVTIQLELLDAAGNAVPGPFNNVTRTIQLKAAE